jgi:uncharacterized protein YciI
MANEYDIKMDKLRRDAQKGEPVASEGKSPQQGGSRKTVGEDLSVEAIADALNRNPEYVKSLIDRGILRERAQADSTPVVIDDNLIEALRFADADPSAINRVVTQAHQRGQHRQIQRAASGITAPQQRQLDEVDALRQRHAQHLQARQQQEQEMASVPNIAATFGSSDSVTKPSTHGLNPPKGASVADPLKSAAMAQPRSTERKS